MHHTSISVMLAAQFSKKKEKGYTFCRYTEQLILFILILLMIDTDVDGVDDGSASH